ncbi:MAG: Hsp20/alpha crystallin family protein [Chitinophagales bacterium]|nr:Hsp20/alpha crystallin family protein [Chitinophagales bacterium]
MKLVRFKNNVPGFFNDNWSNFFNDDFFKSDFRASQPAVNIREGEEGYALEIAAPGLKKEDFNINLDKNILTISVQKENEQNDEQNGYTRREFYYSSFTRSFTLPESVDVESIKGSYENGILTVALPKKADAKPMKRVIEIA